MFYGWWIVIIGCIFDAVKGGRYNTGLTLYFLPVLEELSSPSCFRSATESTR